jgi:hypothetical protein
LPGDLEELRRGIDANNVQSPFGQPVADATLAAWRVQQRVPAPESQQGHGLAGLAVVAFVGELAGVEVQIVVAEHLSKLKRTHRCWSTSGPKASALIGWTREGSPAGTNPQLRG